MELLTEYESLDKIITDAPLGVISAHGRFAKGYGCLVVPQGITLIMTTGHGYKAGYTDDLTNSREKFLRVYEPGSLIHDYNLSFNVSFPIKIGKEIIHELGFYEVGGIISNNPIYGYSLDELMKGITTRTELDKKWEDMEIPNYTTSSDEYNLLVSAGTTNEEKIKSILLGLNRSTQSNMQMRELWLNTAKKIVKDMADKLPLNNLYKLRDFIEDYKFRYFSDMKYFTEQEDKEAAKDILTTLYNRYNTENTKILDELSKLGDPVLGPITDNPVDDGRIKWLNEAEKIIRDKIVHEFLYSFDEGGRGVKHDNTIMSDDMLFDKTGIPISIKLSNVLHNISQAIRRNPDKPKFWLGDFCRSDNNDISIDLNILRGCHKITTSIPEYEGLIIPEEYFESRGLVTHKTHQHMLMRESSLSSSRITQSFYSIVNDLDSDLERILRDNPHLAEYKRIVLIVKQTIDAEQPFDFGMACKIFLIHSLYLKEKEIIDKPSYDHRGQITRRNKQIKYMYGDAGLIKNVSLFSKAAKMNPIRWTTGRSIEIVEILRRITGKDAHRPIVIKGVSEDTPELTFDNANHAIDWLEHWIETSQKPTPEEFKLSRELKKAEEDSKKPENMRDQVYPSWKGVDDRTTLRDRYSSTLEIQKTGLEEATDVGINYKQWNSLHSLNMPYLEPQPEGMGAIYKNNTKNELMIPISTCKYLYSKTSKRKKSKRNKSKRNKSKRKKSKRKKYKQKKSKRKKSKQKK